MAVSCSCGGFVTPRCVVGAPCGAQGTSHSWVLPGRNDAQQDTVSPPTCLRWQECLRTGGLWAAFSPKSSGAVIIYSRLFDCLCRNTAVRSLLHPSWMSGTWTLRYCRTQNTLTSAKSWNLNWLIFFRVWGAQRSRCWALLSTLTCLR